MTDSLVGALVLAGGAGRRAAPRDKLLTRDPEGRTMIGRTVLAAMAAGVDATLLVLGHEAERVRAACPGTDWIEAPDHAEGIAGSLRCGIAHAERAGWSAVVVCLGDMPLVTATTIGLLVRTWRDAPVRPDAVLPLSEGRRGNPVLWDRRMFASLLGLHGDVGARALLDRPDVATVVLEVGDPGVLEDFDTPGRLALFEAGGR